MPKEQKYNRSLPEICCEMATRTTPLTRSDNDL